MPRLVARSWNGIVHHAIEHVEQRRAAHLAEPLGRRLSAVNVSEEDTRLGIDKLVALQSFREAMKAGGCHGA